MNKERWSIRVAWFLLLLTPCLSFGQKVPDLINYQGLLTDSTGKPLEKDGEYTVELRIWDDPTSPDATPHLIWGRSFGVVVVNGRFNVILSDDGGILSDAPSTNLANAFAAEERYLQITIISTPEGPVTGPNPIVPRQRILSVPYAINAFNASGTSPIGSITAWHRDFENTPPLPEGWVQCDGQVLDDPSSPYHGKTIPNLNSPPSTDNSGGFFLRGAPGSGQLQIDQMQGHYHWGPDDVILIDYKGSCNQWLPGSGGAGIDGKEMIEGPRNDGRNGEPRTGKETRPVSFSVIWIMRIK